MKEIKILSRFGGESLVRCSCGHEFNMTLDPENLAQPYPWKVMCPNCRTKEWLQPFTGEVTRGRTPAPPPPSSPMPPR